MKRVLALILALLFLCSCASAPKTGRVSEKELAKLRNSYPYHVVQFPENIHIDFSAGYWDHSYLFFSYLYNNWDFLVAAIEIQSEPYYKTVHKDYPGKFKDLDDFMQQYPDLDRYTATLIFEEGTLYWDALVIDVLCGTGSLPVNETFDLMIADSVMQFDFENTLSLYTKGTRMVCLLSPWRKAGVHAPNAHGTAPWFSWYLTEDDVVLSCTQAPGPDYYSGLYLESFKQELLTLLNEEQGESP